MPAGSEVTGDHLGRLLAVKCDPGWRVLGHLRQEAGRVIVRLEPAIGAGGNAFREVGEANPELEDPVAGMRS